MKKNLLYGLMLSATALSLWSCTEDINPGGSAVGKISTTVNLDTDAIKPHSSKARAEAQGITVSDLKLNLLPDDNSQTPLLGVSVEEFNNSDEFKVGSYKIEAYYGKSSDEGFESPYYFGESQKFTVLENKVTNVSVNVALANTMVTISTTEAFDSYFGSASFQLNTAGSTNTFDYASNETRPLYMTPGEITVYAKVKRPSDGAETTVKVISFNAAARHHYSITADINNGSAGNAVMNISFIDTVGEQIEVPIELSDELFAYSAPSIKLSGYDANASYRYIQGNCPADLKPELQIFAPGGVKSIVMTQQSDWLTAQGIGSTVELVNCAEADHAKYQQIGIEGKYSNVDKLAVINLTRLFNNIRYVDGTSNESSISFLVTDTYGKVSEPVVLNATIDCLVATIADDESPIIYFGESTMELAVDYNGNDFAKDIRFEFKNNRDTWSEAPYDIFEQDGSRYFIGLKNLRTDGTTITIRLILEEKVAETRNIDRVDLQAVVNANDVFARSAIVQLVSSSIDLNSATIQVAPASDPYNFTNATFENLGNGAYRIKNLSGNTEYRVRGIIGKNRATTSFTTEVESQIPNGDMETWAMVSKGNYWSNPVPGASLAASAWGTNNPLTTSAGADMGYCRSASTLETTGRNGKGALLRTIGWGSGNTGTALVATGIMKYSDPGLLHLGSSRSSRPSGYTDREGPLTTDDLTCGIEFASRPAALSFWYKYSARNSSDNGYAEVKVFDVNGNIIASATMNISNAANYTQAVLPLTYGAGVAKAAKIYVKFLSTNNRDYLKKESKNFTAPSGPNSRYEGSNLYIDDITLTY